MDLYEQRFLGCEKQTKGIVNVQKGGRTPCCKIKILSVCRPAQIKVKGFEDRASFTFIDIPLTRHLKTKYNTLNAKREERLKIK